VLRIRKEGKVQILKDDTVRKPTYSASANLSFPFLYPHGELSPLDFQDNKLARYLLKKKQSLYAHRMRDGRLQWTFSKYDVHMAHQYSRLSKQTVRARVGYYLSSHPAVAHVPLNNIISAFRDGVDKDSGLLDSHLPDLTNVYVATSQFTAKMIFRTPCNRNHLSKRWVSERFRDNQFGPQSIARRTPFDLQVRARQRDKS